jgi:hypothetical protein
LRIIENFKQRSELYKFKQLISLDFLLSEIYGDERPQQFKQMVISKLELIKNQKNFQDEPTSEILNAVVHLINNERNSKEISHVANEVYQKI